MFLIGKLLTFLVLPPGGIILICAAAGVFALRRRAHIPAVLAFSSTLLLYSLSIQPVSNFLLFPLERASLPKGETEPRLIVALGGGAISARFSPDNLTGTSRVLSGDSATRATEAAALHLESGLPIALSGGSPLETGVESEASAAFRVLLRLGVPSEAITIEGESRNTWENAQFLKDKTEFRSIYLVTSAFHMKRAIESFAAQGYSVTPRPTNQRVSAGGITFWDWLPTPSDLDDSVVALHEHIGRLFYRIRYGSGGYRILSTELP